jgi:RNA polymerase sigma factor (sigma-70 family)
MARRSVSTLRGRLHALYTAGVCGGLSDRELLARFVDRRDEVAELAFSVLVERHGPMVLGVCRRFLVDPQDAEDAFQATFLVLARKAAALRIDGSAGRWLHGVAMRVAARARSDVLRRRDRERSAAGGLERAARPVAPEPAEFAELKAILNEELDRLPLRLQAAFMLCDLQGSSHQEAARRLGLRIGTVKSRLARARARLRQRLLRRGLGPADLSITLPQIRIGVPDALIETTSHVAVFSVSGRLFDGELISAPVAALTQGVLKMMFVTRLKFMTAAALVILTGSAVLLSRASAQNPAGQSAASGNPAVSAKHQGVSSDDEIDVVMLERAWAEAIPRRDSTVVGRVLADDFSRIDSGGIVSTRERYLSDLVKGVLPGEWAEDEIIARILGDTALVTSRTKLGPASGWVRTTNVYLKRRGRWQCVASHCCRIDAERADTRRAINGSLTFDKVQTAGDEAKAEVNLLGSRFPVPADKPISRSEQVRIRPRFECLVQRIHVRIGEIVKKGDALIEVFSPELAKAKNDYLSAQVQAAHDQRLLEMRRKLHTEKAISEQLWVDSQNAAEKSRLELQAAHDRLMVLGVDDEAIGRTEAETGDQKARLTLRSHVDGTIAEVGAELGNLYDRKDVLLVISTAASTRPPQPKARY